jgi:hypothetical protein
MLITLGREDQSELDIFVASTILILEHRQRWTENRCSRRLCGSAGVVLGRIDQKI